MQPHEIFAQQLDMVEGAINASRQRRTSGPLPTTPPGECLCHIKTGDKVNTSTRVILTWGDYHNIAGYGESHDGMAVYKLGHKSLEMGVDTYAEPASLSTSAYCEQARMFYTGSMLVPVYAEREKWPMAGSTALALLLPDNNPEVFNFAEPSKEEQDEMMVLGKSRGVVVRYTPNLYEWTVQDNATGHTVSFGSLSSLGDWLKSNPGPLGGC
jgi:hypothetical protein